MQGKKGEKKKEVTIAKQRKDKCDDDHDDEDDIQMQG